MQEPAIQSTSSQFLWAVGIEDTFVTAPWHGTGRGLDEYELTGHYRRWRSDLDLAASLRVGAMRYGIPWHRVNPGPGHWDWSWADRPVERLLELNITPILDLVHYGTPAWLEGSFLHPDYPRRVGEYAAQVAARYRGRIRWYTPLNEPRITAWYAGMLGWWPPNLRGWRGFAAVLNAVCRGIVHSERAIREVDPGNRMLHVDATDLYKTAEPALEADAALRQQIVFLALDLVSGRVDAAHPLHDWLLRHGVRDGDLAWFRQDPLQLDHIGINLYPMFTRKVIRSTPRGRRIDKVYGDGAMLDELARAYWRRYERPLMISETASLGSVRRRLAWLEESVAAVRRLREDGVPVTGYTWWPLFSLVTWAYRQRSGGLERYWAHMGLWDVDPRPGANLRRVRTAVADAYAALVAAGDEPVGRLRMAGEAPPVRTGVA